MFSKNAAVKKVESSEEKWLREWNNELQAATNRALDRIASRSNQQQSEALESDVLKKLEYPEAELDKLFKDADLQAAKNHRRYFERTRGDTKRAQSLQNILEQFSKETDVAKVAAKTRLDKCRQALEETLENSTDKRSYSSINAAIESDLQVLYGPANGEKSFSQRVQTKYPWSLTRFVFGKSKKQKTAEHYIAVDAEFDSLLECSEKEAPEKKEQLIEVALKISALRHNCSEYGFSVLKENDKQFRKNTNKKLMELFSKQENAQQPTDYAQVPPDENLLTIINNHYTWWEKNISTKEYKSALKLAKALNRVAINKEDIAACVKEFAGNRSGKKQDSGLEELTSIVSDELNNNSVELIAATEVENRTQLEKIESVTYRVGQGFPLDIPYTQENCDYFVAQIFKENKLQCRGVIDIFSKHLASLFDAKNPNYYFSLLLLCVDYKIILDQNDSVSVYKENLSKLIVELLISSKQEVAISNSIAIFAETAALPVYLTRYLPDSVTVEGVNPDKRRECRNLINDKLSLVPESASTAVSHNGSRSGSPEPGVINVSQTVKDKAIRCAKVVEGVVTFGSIKNNVTGYLAVQYDKASESSVFREDAAIVHALWSWFGKEHKKDGKNFFESSERAYLTNSFVAVLAHLNEVKFGNASFNLQMLKDLGIKNSATFTRLLSETEVIMQPYIPLHATASSINVALAPALLTGESVWRRGSGSPALLSQSNTSSSSEDSMREVLAQGAAVSNKFVS